MDDRNRSDHAINVTEADENVTAVSDILEHLHDILDGPFPMYVLRQDLCDIISEITRLEEERNMWQSTAAGLSQDISNAEDEIERLHQKEEDILAGIQLVVKGSNAGRDEEIERLKTKIENLQAHIQWLTQIAQERIHD